MVGNARSIGVCIALAFLTLGLYSFVWTYQTFDELRRSNGRGLGGGAALLLLVVVSPVLVFLAPWQVGEAFIDLGEDPPVTALTGFWWLVPLLGPLVWFVRVQGSLNELWEG